MFKTHSHAKFILTGEHSVLDGGKALAFPLPNLKWSLQFEPDEQIEKIERQHIDVDHQPWPRDAQYDGTPPQTIEPSEASCHADPTDTVDPTDTTGTTEPTDTDDRSNHNNHNTAGDVKLVRQAESNADFLFYQALQWALHFDCRTENDIKGRIKITSQIPMGCGLGSSAACSLAIARLWQALGWRKSDKDVFEWARQIEGHFHSRSSGLDVAALMHPKPIVFCKAKSEEFQTSWWPKFKLTYAGGRGHTGCNVRRVIDWRKNNKDLSAKTTNTMHTATNLAFQALQTHKSVASFKQLREAIALANSCFQEWGLVPQAMRDHMLQLKRDGAVATKPTGSGGGGYVLSLWP